VLSVAEKARKSVSGEYREDERKQTIEDVSKAENEGKTSAEAVHRDKSGGNLITDRMPSGIKVA